MRILKHLNRIVVLEPWKRRRDVFKPGDIALQFRQLFAAILEHSADDECNKLFGEIHYVVELGISHFRLNHPKLSKVPARLGLLSSERRSEAVDLSERGC